MSKTDRFDKQRVAAELEETVDLANELAEKLGLDPYPVNYWIVDYDEMNELIAYDGFQHRYPHWRWGMKYDRQQKQSQFGMGKAFEIVNNDNPSHAFLQESNDLADQKAVITHVEAHADFFKNNEWFGLFDDGDPDAAATLERHATKIQEYMSDPDIDRAEVEKWIDHALVLEDCIDQHREYTPVPGDEADDQTPDAAEDVADRLGDLELADEVREEIFDDEWLEAQREDDEAVSFPEEPERDVLAFLRKHGKQYDEEAGKAVEMTEWQRDVLDMLHEEAYYFAPQKMTKVMNEGWACVAPETRVFTSEGLVPMAEVVDRRPDVSDGESSRAVYDANVIRNHDTVTIETRRGFELTGSNNHRVRRPDGSWVRLDELEAGDAIEISAANGQWPDDYVAVDWTPPEHVTLDDVAEQAGVSPSTVLRYRRTGRAERAEAIEQALSRYDGERQDIAQLNPITVPDTVDEQFGRFLGLLVGDGHVPSNSRHVGFTAESKGRAEEFAGLVDELFGIDPDVTEQGDRYRVYAYSENLRSLLVDEIGLPTGKAAAEKTVPDVVLRSPKPVVAEFLRGLFDADGYAGDQGAILSTKSEDMSRLVQLLLTNFGVLSRRRKQQDGCYHVHVTGASADRFADAIGFGYVEKSDRLDEYLDGLEWFEDESWTDEVVEIEHGTGDVYDISVRETHRYAAAGLVNHNSYWESMMMGEEAFAGADEFLSYADHQARVLGSPGLNPYKLGKQLWEYVENRTNRREVVERLLRVEGVTWRNFEDVIDYDEVLELLEPPAALDRIGGDRLDAVADLPDEYLDRDALERAREEEVDVDRHPWRVLTYEGLARRHYSLVKPQHRGFLPDVDGSTLERIDRYLFDDTRYGDVAAAIEDVDFTAGWDRMYEIRESHNDVTFIDEFLTDEFVEDNDYFTYEYSHASEDFRVASRDADDVRQKLLLQFTNFGKPTVAVYDGNFRNRNELLLGHQYNGIALDVPQAKRVLERIYELWGRPVNLKTIVKEIDEHDAEVAQRRGEEPEPEEKGRLIRYDGDEFEEEDLEWSEVEHLAADDVDYDTKPDEWLQ